ncbi:g6622 [Coccomyxa elongata]
MLAIRREVVDYGAIPLSSWLPHGDSTVAIQAWLRQAIPATREDGTHRWADVNSLAKSLNVPQQHAQILIDTIDALAEAPQEVVQRPEGTSEANVVDVCAVALYMFAQLYIRQAQRADAMDVWPSSSPQAAAAAFTGSPFSQGMPFGSEPSSSMNAFGSGAFGVAEPSSPTRSGSSTSSPSRSGSGPASPFASPSVHFQQQKSNHLVRKELQAHLFTHQQMLAGYTDYIKRHTHALLQLVLNNPQKAEGSLHSGTISAAEFDRLGFLLRGSAESTAAQDGSPMDVSPSPFQEDGWRLSAHVPHFQNNSQASSISLAAVADWMSDNIFDELEPADAMVSSPPKGGRRGDLPPAGVVQGGSVDIQGVCKSTVVRGEDNFPAGILRVTDCHDTVVYALAPLNYAKIAGCSDCTVMIGAVGRVLKVERCERVQLVASAVRLSIASCHDCVFYLGVNRPPLLLGDNRFLQMAPYNTQYERLPVHMAKAGVTAEPNLWNRPVTLGREHRPATPDSDSATSAAGKARMPFTLLPPDKLLPLMVPFKGGPGPLCGGAASGGESRMSADVGSFVGLGDSGGGGSGPLAPSPFRLPAVYEEAKERKVSAVSDLRNAVKAAALDDGKKRELQAVIQSYFKDWLMTSGNMRQVYDLARMEREEASTGTPAAQEHSNSMSADAPTNMTLEPPL